MARRKKEEVVSIDEVREDFAETPVEGEAETPAEETTPDETAPESATEISEGEAREESEATAEIDDIADPGDATKVVSDSMQLRVRLSDAELVEYGTR